MARLLFLIMLIVTLLSCDQPSGINSSSDQQISDAGYHQSDKLIQQGSLLSLSDAEKILGEPANLIDSSTQRKNELLTIHLAYKANADDAMNKKTGVIYFLLQQYDNIGIAQKKYFYFKDANEDHGIVIRNDLGDEAYFHTDTVNFYFIMVRKGSKVFNMKVNKITSKTSLEEFNKIAGKITSML